MDEDNLITKGCEVYNCSGCNNVFHKSCMNDWVKMKVECPMCRKDLTDDVEHVDKFEQWVLENIDIIQLKAKYLYHIKPNVYVISASNDKGNNLFIYYEYSSTASASAAASEEEPDIRYIREKGRRLCD